MLWFGQLGVFLGGEGRWGSNISNGRCPHVEIQGLGFRILGIRVQDSGFRIQDFGVRVEITGCRV